MPGTIRKATSDDAEQISQIIAELVAEPSPVALREALTTEQVTAWIERQGENGAMFVIDDGRRLIGFAALDFDSSRPDECSFGAWIRQRNRRQGHGTALAEEALAFARTRGYKRIRARLPEQNEAALSYLSAIGALVPMTNPGSRFELPVYQEPE